VKKKKNKQTNKQTKKEKKKEEKPFNQRRTQGCLNILWQDLQRVS
jgi:hypothetical protein